MLGMRVPVARCRRRHRSHLRLCNLVVAHSISTRLMSRLGRRRRHRVVRRDQVHLGHRDRVKVRDRGRMMGWRIIIGVLIRSSWEEICFEKANGCNCLSQGLGLRF